MSTSPARRHGDGAPPDTPSFQVLVVDDDPNLRLWLGLVIRRLGLGVASVSDGEAALKELEARHYDLLVCDLEMPHVNGMEVIQRVRVNPRLAHLYAVMLTGHDEIEAKVQALTLGYDDFLSKNCTEVEVVARIIAAKRMLTRNRLLTAAATQWQHLATRDELTGVSTRRTLVDEGELALREKRVVGIAILDLDDFKPINDNFGHLMGDRILRDVGALFLKRTRSHDLIARYGGDEFVLLVRDLPFDDLVGASERLVREIEQLQWTMGDVMFSIRITSGIAHSSLLPGNATLNQLLDTADRDLYAKKWVKKHPSAAPELYEYPAAARPGSVVPLPANLPQPMLKTRAVEEEG
jgi:two-component system cell cycle response regulator